MTLKILILSGVTHKKLEKLSSDLIAYCSKKGMGIQVVTANVFKDDIDALEEKEKPAVILSVGIEKLSDKTPVINGLALMYPWLGIEKVVDEIWSHYRVTNEI